MSLLRVIQDGTTDHSVALADLLRRCLILAYRLQHDSLAKWAEQELNGYPDIDELPPYRKTSAEVRGNFRNVAREVNNALIPSLAVEEKHRDQLFSQAYTEGVAHYEALLISGEQNFGSTWPANFVAYYQTRLMEGYYLVDARKLISRGEIQGMLDQIRNRILSFALEIEKENPAAGEVEPGGGPAVPPQKVDQIYNTYILRWNECGG